LHLVRAEPQDTVKVEPRRRIARNQVADGRQVPALCGSAGRDRPLQAAAGLEGRAVGNADQPARRVQGVLAAELTGTDRGGAAVGIQPVERQTPGADLLQRAGSEEHARVGRRLVVVANPQRHAGR